MYGFGFGVTISAVSSILRHSIFSPDGWVEYFLPRDRWKPLLTNEETVGGQWRRERYDYFQMPLWASGEDE